MAWEGGGDIVSTPWTNTWLLGRVGGELGTVTSSWPSQKIRKAYIVDPLGADWCKSWNRVGWEPAWQVMGNLGGWVIANLRDTVITLASECCVRQRVGLTLYF